MATEGSIQTLYHGTSVILADEIVKNGLKPSTAGCLGQGVYLSCLDKASNFALDAPFRQKGEGAVVFKVEVKVDNTKYINGEDREGKWKQEGYDSVCTSHTSFSRREEWCVADSSRCKLVSRAIIYYRKRFVTEEDFQPIEENSKKKIRPTCPGRSNWGKHHPAEDGVRVSCPGCREFRCSNCIHVHLAHCRGIRVVEATKSPLNWQLSVINSYTTGNSYTSYNDHSKL